MRAIVINSIYFKRIKNRPIFNSPVDYNKLEFSTFVNYGF
ncbi:hypothetical protein RICGR_0687 [Rickettsiella grylli]|uniref:Uncharacterized protein n=1 Tax=Rickettsiella grylli TaxID=59196 RepID=A8PMC2_9COXI|nr:hypothetical protein RICGR_0687 [Rickettsiella grylli]